MKFEILIVNSYQDLLPILSFPVILFLNTDIQNVRYMYNLRFFFIFYFFLIGLFINMTFVVRLLVRSGIKKSCYCGNTRFALSFALA